MSGSIFQALVSIVILLGILYLAYIASKYLGTASIKQGSSKHIRLLEVMSLGQDRAVAAIKVGDKNLLIGISQGGINKITDLDEGDIAQMLADDLNPTFNQGFKDMMNKIGKDR